jgi:hypothetical protein
LHDGFFAITPGHDMVKSPVELNPRLPRHNRRFSTVRQSVKNNRLTPFSSR